MNMIRLTYDPDLVEEAVLLAEGQMGRVDARAFRLQRDRIYGVADAEERDRRFRALHDSWFLRVGLHRPVDRAMSERPELADRLAEGRVVRAVTRRQEGADLLDCGVGESKTRPMLVVRLQPATFVAADALLTLLRHELLHISDMLDPAFGYQRALPRSADGPSYDNILRDRYRVLWDVTIDGRLARAGLLSDTRVRVTRQQEFSAVFRMLGDRCHEVFDEWFDRQQPSHASLLAFALTPDKDRRGADNVTGRCPLCRFPVGSLDPRPERLSSAARAAISTEHPAWRIEQGVCSQCLDLYEARSEDLSEARFEETSGLAGPEGI
jgi:hypothetical protein